MKNLQYLLMLTIALNNHDIKSAETSEIQTKQINTKLSFETLKNRQQELDQLAANITSSYENELSKLNEKKQNNITQYQKTKSDKKNRFNTLMKQRKESFQASQQVSENLSQEELDAQVICYNTVNTRLEEEINNDLKELKEQLDLELTDLEKEYKELFVKHNEEKIKLITQEDELTIDFKQGATEAFINQHKHLKAIEKAYSQNRLENKANTPKNEFHDERGYLYGSCFTLQADPEDTLCSNCLDTQGNLKTALKNNNKISQATQQALLFAAKKIQNIEDGVLTLIDENYNLYAIKHGTDIRYFSVEKEFSKTTNDTLRNSKDFFEDNTQETK